MRHGLFASERGYIAQQFAVDLLKDETLRVEKLLNPQLPSEIQGRQRGIASIKLDIRGEIYEFACGSTREFSLT